MSRAESRTWDDTASDERKWWCFPEIQWWMSCKSNWLILLLLKSESILLMTEAEKYRDFYLLYQYFVNKYLFFLKWELSRTTTIIVQFMMLCHPLVIRLAEDDKVLISVAGWNECERRTWRQWMWDSVNNRAHLTFIVQILLHKWDVLMGTATSTTYCIGWMYHRHMTRKLNGASRLSRL